MEKSGATQFIYAYNMSNAGRESNNTQLYHLWNQEQSPYLGDHLRSMERWDNYAPSGSQDRQRWRFYLLFDENNDLLGYTVRCNNGSVSYDSERMCPMIEVSAPGAGETVTVQLMEEGEDFYSMDVENLKDVMPDVVSLDSFSSAVLGHDLDDYIPHSRKMAHWVASGDASAHRSQRVGFNTQSSSMRCLLFFSDETTLCGYAFFWGGETEDGVMDLEITLCDYDLTGIYGQLSDEFAGVNMFTRLKEIAPKDMEAEGVAQVCSIDSVNTTHAFGEQLQGYYLWIKTSTGVGLSNNCAPLDWAQENWFAPEEDRIACYLLLDENYEVLGYTRIKG